MTIYDLIYEEINDRYENGELTLEQANEVNDLAYEKYVSEGAFKKYRDMAKDANDKNMLLTRIQMDDKISDKRNNKIDKARDKYNKIVKNYEKLTNGKNDKPYYTVDLDVSREEDLKRYNKNKKLGYDDQDFYDKDADRNHERQLDKKYGDNIHKTSLKQKIARKRDFGSIDLKNNNKYDTELNKGLNHTTKDFKDSETYKNLKNHKEAFKKNTEGPTKRVINPNNESGRYSRDK